MFRCALKFVSNLLVNNIRDDLSASIRKCSTAVNLKLQNELACGGEDADTFGSLSKPLEERSADDEGDRQEEALLENIVPNHAERLRTSEYAKMIKDLLGKRKVLEAISVLEERAIKQDRIKPESYLYNLVIGGCGRVGYTKKAFKLFNDMKKRGLQPTGGTYTALFNACSNSPWLEDGLSRATNLKELMSEKGYRPNETTYNAMIKAFGHCGDMHTAFALVDQMIADRIRIKTDTINFLLHSCITNTEAGFLHALLVWRKFRAHKIVPDIYSFNLLLQCVRDCDLGDADVAGTLLLGVAEAAERVPDEIQCKETALIGGGEPEAAPHLPDLLAAVPRLGNMVELRQVRTAEQRLLLLGGFIGLLDTMRAGGVAPDIKTCTMLLEALPGTLAAEHALLVAMRKENVQPDVDMLNALIRKRALRGDYQHAKAVLELFSRYSDLRPNLFTYGALALACETLDEAQMLLTDMCDNGYRVNIQILGALLKQACIKHNFVYVLQLMELVINEKIPPNKKFLQHLQELRTFCIEQNKSEKQVDVLLKQKKT